jgi:hypothetical protein
MSEPYPDSEFPNIVGMCQRIGNGRDACRIVKNVVRTHNLTSAQAKQLGKVILGKAAVKGKRRKEAIAMLCWKLSDPENIDKVLNLFDYDDEKADVRTLVQAMQKGEASA